MGNHEATCNHRTEVFSRVVGYYSPLFTWNKGKLSEYRDRTTYKEERNQHEEQREKKVCSRDRNAGGIVD